MDPIDSRRVIWASVAALMAHHWGGENLQRLAREAGIGPASCSRLKAQQTSVGVELLEKVAAIFGVQAWQLLVPGFDPKSPPVLMPVSAPERAFYERMLDAAKALKPASK